MITIQGLPNDRLINSDKQVTLRDGQIVQGKVNKIYPNNRAEIQVGDKRLIAEILTPLSVGKKYFFQVEQGEKQIVQFKVISTHMKNNQIKNITELMRNLSIPVTKLNTQLVQMLMNDRIPFERQQIIAAVQLLENLGGKPEFLSTIKEMIVNKLPLTEYTLRSLIVYESHSLSSLLKTALHDVSGHPQQTLIEKDLQRLLEDLLVRSVSMKGSEQVSGLSKVNNQQLASSTTELIKQIPTPLLRMIIQSLPVLQFTSNPEETLPQFPLASQRENLMQALLTNLEELTTNVKQELVRENVSDLIRKGSVLQTVVKQFVHSEPLYSGSMSNEQFFQLKNELIDRLLPLLPKNGQQVINALLQQNTSENQQLLSSLLQTLQLDEFYILLETTINNATDKQLNSQIIQSRFLNHFHQFIETIGLANEAMIKNVSQLASGQIQDNSSVLPTTIKLLLTQMMQQENGRVTENMQLLAHFITGMQLQASENNNIIQIPIQLPGEKIGLPSDLFIKFEGKKTEDGRIDADYCRILFMLDLFTLKETVIDMHVQKRIISLTIYNEQSPTLKHQAQPLVDKLENNLASINYQLSGLKWKRLEKQTKTERIEKKTNSEENLEQKGFDMWI